MFFCFVASAMAIEQPDLASPIIRSVSSGRFWKKAKNRVFISGFVPFFWTKNSRTFQGFSRTHFPFFKDSFQCQLSNQVFAVQVKRADSRNLSLESMSLLLLPKHEQFYSECLSVSAPFPLEFEINCKVSNEIQGRSSTDCNFHTCANPVTFISEITL